MYDNNVFDKPNAVELVRMLRRENDGCEETNELTQQVIAQFSIQNAGSMNIFSFEGVYFNFFCVNLHFRIDVFGDAVVDV